MTHLKGGGGVGSHPFPWGHTYLIFIRRSSYSAVYSVSLQPNTVLKRGTNIKIKHRNKSSEVHTKMYDKGSLQKSILDKDNRKMT